MLGSQSAGVAYPDGCRFGSVCPASIFTPIVNPPSPPYGIDPVEFKARIARHHEAVNASGGWIQMEQIVNLYVQLIEDTTLNGAALEITDAKLHKVVILRYPHIDGNPNPRALQYIPDEMKPKGPITINTKVNRDAVKLNGQVALITGASDEKGIGYNVADALCKAG